MDGQSKTQTETEKLVDVDEYSSILEECVDVQVSEFDEQKAGEEKSAFDDVKALEEMLAKRVSMTAIISYGLLVFIGMFVFSIYVVLEAANVKAISAVQARTELSERLGANIGLFDQMEGFREIALISASGESLSFEELEKRVDAVNRAFELNAPESASSSFKAQNFDANSLLVHSGQVSY